MDKDILNKYKEAGRIAIEAIKLAKEKLKPGIKLLDLANEIENKILSLGGKIAFPVNLSLNEEAAHSVLSLCVTHPEQHRRARVPSAPRRAGRGSLHAHTALAL